MDVPAVTVPAANAVTQQVLNTEGQPLESGMIGGEFAALLALGLNLPQPGGEAKTPQFDLATNENAAESSLIAPPIEVLAVLPQITPQVPVAAPAVTASDIPATPAPVPNGDLGNVLQVGEPQITPDFNLAQDATIADRAAIIAARSETANLVTDADAHLTQVASPAQLGHKESAPAELQRLAELQRFDMPETAPRPEPFAHAFASAQPIENRPPLTHTSALLEVAAPVSEPGFADALSRQVVWMVDKDAQVAELRINPPELGPVEVRLTLSGDEAQAQFVSAHAEVREAIENALVRLREALAQAGIQLGEASVSAESFANQAQRDSATARQQYGDDRQQHNSAAQSNDARTSARRGLVDVFA